MLIERAGSEAVALVRETAERAAACFHDSLCMGVDVALTPSFHQARVLEVNAFGDLLEGVTWRGADTYTWAVRAALKRDWPPS
jgi:glutathione synthase/RimK-type ligase-like ATP-grasp enzyme